ncbi:MAG: hypothetical protein VW548_00600 [Methylotenera sp.]
MNMYLIPVAMSLLVLAGCASNPAAEQARATQQMEYKIQVYGPACEKLGFAKDTDKWRECIQREYEQSLMRLRNVNPPPYWGPYYDRFYMRPWY